MLFTSWKYDELEYFPISRPLVYCILYNVYSYPPPAIWLWGQFSWLSGHVFQSRSNEKKEEIWQKMWTQSEKWILRGGGNSTFGRHDFLLVFTELTITVGFVFQCPFIYATCEYRYICISEQSFCLPFQSPSREEFDHDRVIVTERSQQVNIFLNHR